MQARLYLLACLAPLIACAPVPAAPDGRQGSSSLRYPIAVTSSSSSSSSPFNPNLKAVITHKRARVRETSAADALAAEKRAYELEVSRGGGISVVSTSAHTAAAAAADDVPDTEI